MCNLFSFIEPELPASKGSMETLAGKTVVGGIAVAKLLTIAKREDVVRKQIVDTKAEITRFENILRTVKAEMKAEAQAADTKSGEVLSAQLMMLEDDSFVKEVHAKSGQKVTVGELLVEVDLDCVTKSGYNPMVITILLDTETENNAVELFPVAFDGNSFTFVITDPVGIHARPAGDLVNLVKRLECKVQVRCSDKTADGRSVIQLMKLGAAKGSKLEVKAEGKDAGKALASLQQYMQNNL